MKLKSTIDPNSEAFAKNAAHHRALAEQLRARTAEIALGGPKESRDRHVKRDFSAVDSRTVLAKVLALPITTWSYQADAGVRHLGPMAQDFSAAFALGLDDKHISMVDADGVALAAIQGLNQKLEAELQAQRAAAQRKDERITALEQELSEIKRLMLLMAERKP